MHLSLKIEREGSIEFIEKEFKKISGNHYIAKWGNIEEDGAYLFTLINKGEKREKSITFSHTAPFSKLFEAYADEKESSRPIAGIRKGMIF